MRFVKSLGDSRHVVVIATAAAVLGLATPMPANAVSEVPFKARLSGTAALTSPTTVEFHEQGQAMYLGNYVGVGVAILDPRTGTCPSGVPGFPNVHTETLTRPTAVRSSSASSTSAALQGRSPSTALASGPSSMEPAL